MSMTHLLDPDEIGRRDDEERKAERKSTRKPMMETKLRDLTENVVREKVGGTRGANNVLARLATAESDCVADLLRGVPAEGGNASLKTLEKVVATAFQSGVIHASKFVHQADF